MAERADADAGRLAPGITRPSRFRPPLHWELVACSFSGHELVATDAEHVRPQDALVVREIDGERWHRCLRCDSWVVLPAPVTPAREHPPERDAIDLPLRGRPLRDKFVLRIIAVDRAFHFVVLGLLAILVFAVASNETTLRHTFSRVISDIQTGLGGTARTTKGGFVGRAEELLGAKQGTLHTAGIVLAGYAILEGVEAVGLWLGKRWAEYLTFIATALLLPLEIYELSQTVTPFKVIALLINIAVVVYLLLAKRLFGLRGGAAAERAERDRDLGWDALERVRPFQPARDPV
jgi:uncharacterized membrane protein (DUF2068 family)